MWQRNRKERKKKKDRNMSLKRLNHWVPRTHEIKTVGCLILFLAIPMLIGPKPALSRRLTALRRSRIG